jgi:hypothetical protein
MGPRVEPAPIPITVPNGDMTRIKERNGFDSIAAIPPTIIYNMVVANNLPAASKEAAAVAKAQDLDDGEYGLNPDRIEGAYGTTLYAVKQACNTFNVWADGKNWGEGGKWSGYTWTNQYAGWGMYAVDDGYYKPEAVTFDMERVIGPGEDYNPGRDGTSKSPDDGQYSAKIASTQPFAAGIASPIFTAPAGATVTVEVNYLLFDHQGVLEKDWYYDWASLGVKPDAYGDAASYVNGYTRGQWAKMVNTITVGDSGKFMVLLGANNPAAINSNIYFDNVVISIDGKYMGSCEY